MKNLNKDFIWSFQFDILFNLLYFVFIILLTLLVHLTSWVSWVILILFPVYLLFINVAYFTHKNNKFIFIYRLVIGELIIYSSLWLKSWFWGVLTGAKIDLETQMVDSLFFIILGAIYFVGGLVFQIYLLIKKYTKT